MNDLVQRLSQGTHDVEVVLRPERTVEALRESLDRGYVHILFKNTRGGTALSVPVDRQRTDASAADFANKSGRLIVAGELVLDFTKVRCIAEIDLASLEGHAHLEVLEPSEVAL